MAGQEKELTELRQRAALFPKELESAVDKAVKEVADRLKLEAKNREELLRKEFEGERNVFAARTEALEKMNKDLSDQSAKLSKQLEAAYQKVQEIAEKAIEGSSQAKSLADLQKLLAEQGPKDLSGERVTGRDRIVLCLGRRSAHVGSPPGHIAAEVSCGAVSNPESPAPRPRAGVPRTDDVDVSVHLRAHTLPKNEDATRQRPSGASPRCAFRSSQNARGDRTRTPCMLLRPWSSASPVTRTSTSPAIAAAMISTSSRSLI